MSVQEQFGQSWDVTIDADEREYSHGRSYRCRLVSAYWVPATALATHASNYNTLTLKKGAGGTLLCASTGITTNSSGGAAWSKGTPIAFTLTASGKDLEFDASDVLEFIVADAGTTASADGSLVVTWEKARLS